MTITITYDIDPVVLEELIDDGYTVLELWYSTTPDGTYANASATASPVTLALMSSGEDYSATLTYSGGNAGMWFKVRAFDGSSTRTDISLSSPFHGGGGTTLTRLRQLLGREMRDMRVGTLTTSTSTTSQIFSSVDVTRWGSGWFQDWITHNTTRGAWAKVTAWTSPTATNSPAITGQVSGDSVELTRRFTPTEYKDAINWAISSTFPKLSRTVVHQGTLTATNIFQFDVPNDIRIVNSVEVESSAFITDDSNQTRGHPWMNIPYRLIRDGLSQKLEFIGQQTPDRRLRITGTAPLSQLNAETDYVELLEPNTDLLIHYAAFYLYRGLINEAASTDVERYANLADHHMKMAQTYGDQLSTPRRPQKMWGLMHSTPKSTGFISASFLKSNF